MRRHGGLRGGSGSGSGRRSRRRRKGEHARPGGERLRPVRGNGDSSDGRRGHIMRGVAAGLTTSAPDEIAADRTRALPERVARRAELRVLTKPSASLLEQQRSIHNAQEQLTIKWRSISLMSASWVATLATLRFKRSMSSSMSAFQRRMRRLSASNSSSSRSLRFWFSKPDMF